MHVSFIQGQLSSNFIKSQTKYFFYVASNETKDFKLHYSMGKKIIPILVCHMQRLGKEEGTQQYPQAGLDLAAGYKL